MLDCRRVYLFKSTLSLGFNCASDNSATALCQCFAVPHAVIRALYLEFHRNTPRNAAKQRCLSTFPRKKNITFHLWLQNWRVYRPQFMAIFLKNAQKIAI
jgi:hypothetical protein